MRVQTEPARVPPEDAGRPAHRRTPPGASGRIAAAAVPDTDKSIPDSFIAHWPFRWLSQQVELSVQSVHRSGLRRDDQLVPAGDFGCRDEPLE